MQIFHSIADIAACQEQDRRPSVVTIGSFDGIHLAHRELLRRVCEQARARNAVSVAVSFEPHPLAVLAPSRMPKLLTPLPAKIDLLASTGIDRLLLIPFTTELSQWSAEMFIEQVLVAALHAKAVIVGDNFRFGHRQSGTPELLQQLGKNFSYTAEIFPKMTLRGRTISSSEIRVLLETGKLSHANRLLGRPFSVRGGIATGLGIGARQTVPTFNLDDYPGLLPVRGVYVTRTKLFSDDFSSMVESEAIDSVTNVGTRPTFGEREMGVETHLLQTLPAAAMQPAAMEIFFFHRLRDERKFDSPSALKQQIIADIDRARRYLRRARMLTEPRA